MNPPNAQLRFTDARDGDPVTAETELVADEVPRAPGLCVQRVRLETAEGVFEGRLLRPATRSAASLRLLDNEILAGLRLHRRVGSLAGAEVAGLIGYDVAGTEPFALVEPCRGMPCGTEAGRLLPHDLRRFQASLVAGVRMLEAAGIAHRALGPETVRWDGDRVQITDLSRSALVGEPRVAGGPPPWRAPEQHPEQVDGHVTDRDDLWAVGRLVLFMATGEEPDISGASSASLAHPFPPGLARLLDGVFGPPDRRPTVADMVCRVGATDPVPYGLEPNPALVQGRREFYEVRGLKPVDVGDAPDEPGHSDRATGRPSFPVLSRPSSHWLWIAASAIALLVLTVLLIKG
ncbi:hypothetical protein [Actinomadura oligospora]|uniref:hypothetical protein n=1 Tax=Actinomadura oligospora TaxID=111804 RepID=UPI00047CDA1D|nr:hypothetical protein [Actinomadura oligospora]